MKTVDCPTLELLTENRERINLIDIRTPEQFAASHIPGARSFPFAKLAEPKIFLRSGPNAERIYVVSDDRGTASMAAGILRSRGWMDPVVVDGGMNAWLGHGFPVRRAVPWKAPLFLYAGAILAGMAALLALRNLVNFAWPEVLIAGLLLLIAAVLILKANFFAGLGIGSTSVRCDVQQQEADHAQPALAGSV